MGKQFQAQKEHDMATEKLDLRSRPSKSAIMADLRKRLTDAKKKLEVAIANNDAAKVAKLRQIVSDLQETINR